MNPLATTPERVLLAGDWHGNTRYACSVVEYAHKQGIKLILQLGDFGIWQGDFGRQYLNRLNKVAKQYDVQVLFLGGNHENWDILDEAPLDENGLYAFKSNIWYMPTGTSWVWEGKTWAVIGGAVSVDKLDRVQGVSWWPREELNYTDIDRVLALESADVILAHDMPFGVPYAEKILAENKFGFPSGPIQEANQHRRIIRDLVEVLKPYFFFHGHYHWKETGILTLDNGEKVIVTALGEDGYQIEYNTLIVNIGEITP